MGQQAFPTDDAMRQAAARKEEEKYMTEEDKRAHRKAKRKKLTHEEHFDDFGSDSSPLEKSDWLVLSALSLLSIVSTYLSADVQYNYLCDEECEICVDDIDEPYYSFQGSTFEGCITDRSTSWRCSEEKPERHMPASASGL